MWEKANELVESACQQDNNVRTKVGPDLIVFLDGKGKLDNRQSDLLVDAMTDWLQSSNFKVAHCTEYLSPNGDYFACES